MTEPEAASRPARPVVAFLSDYGLVDEFVGVCKAVIASIAPEATVLDLGHDLPPHEVGACTATTDCALCSPSLG